MAAAVVPVAYSVFVVVPHEAPVSCAADSVGAADRVTAPEERAGTTASAVAAASAVTVVRKGRIGGLLKTSSSFQRSHDGEIRDSRSRGPFQWTGRTVQSGWPGIGGVREP